MFLSLFLRTASFRHLNVKRIESTAISGKAREDIKESQCKEDWKVFLRYITDALEKGSQCKEDWKWTYTLMKKIVRILDLNVKRIERRELYILYCRRRVASQCKEDWKFATASVAYKHPWENLNVKRIESSISPNRPQPTRDIHLNVKRIESSLI